MCMQRLDRMQPFPCLDMHIYTQAAAAAAAVDSLHVIVLEHECILQ